MNASKKPLLDRIRQALSHIDLSVRNIVLWLAASLVLTVITTLGSQVVFTGHLWSSPQENYIAPLSVDVIVNFSAAFITTNLLMALVFAINRIYRFVVPSISERQGERLMEFVETA